MCLIFFSINSHPTYKLIIAGNRDEFYNRETLKAHFWKDNPTILGGRDLEANGTWMAITRQGKISFITNYRDIKNIKQAAPSRGLLVSDYLENNIEPSHYLKKLEPRANDYNGFNLVVGDVNTLWYLSNYKKGFDKIEDGVHGLSNHLLETQWPKIVRGKEMIKPVLEKPSIKVDDLLEILHDTTQAADNMLPDTGVGLQRERALSSMFIKSPGYGSRCSTVILVSHDNHVVFAERTYNLTTFKYTTEKFEFKIDC